MLDLINSILWHDYVLYVVLGTGVLFTIWSGFGQYRALTHGVQVIRGKFDDPNDPGAINHFQALSTALSATVGLGNIAGVAVAVSMGGPGAVFWMWVIGLFGMALKLTEVTQSMLYRNTDDPDNPHGGPMWVVSKGLAQWSPALKPLGVLIGGIFCATIIISAITGGNMFQAFNVAEITHTYFPSVPKPAVGIVLAILVALVIVGGIKRIGAVAGRLVPLMCVLYLLAALLVIGMNLEQVPAMLRMIVVHAFTPTDAAGAFVGGTAGFAFLWGMKRALFSSEAGQGSAPVAHSAAKTDEPVREGVVAGLEPFIDTIVVCTLTTLVILLSGAWSRGSEAHYEFVPGIVQADELVTTEQQKFLFFIDREVERTRYGTVVYEDDSVVRFLNGEPSPGEAAYREWPREQIVSLGPAENHWRVDTLTLPAKTRDDVRISGEWKDGSTLFLLISGEDSDESGQNIHRLHGTVRDIEGELLIAWIAKESDVVPEVIDNGVFNHFVGAALTGHAFDRVMPGLGMWLITLACWLFAVSTMISWSYYGEQGVIYLIGERGVLLYKLGYCALIVVATLGFIRTDEQLDAWTALGTGVMLVANIPIMLLFGAQAMKAYHGYFKRMGSGEMEPPHGAPRFTDVVGGKDVE